MLPASSLLCLDRPADVFSESGESSVWEPWTSGSLPAPSILLSLSHVNFDPLQSLAEYENHKKTFHDTDRRCANRGIRRAPVVLDAHAGGWRHGAKALDHWLTQHSTALQGGNAGSLSLSYVLRISSSLARDFACHFGTTAARKITLVKTPTSDTDSRLLGRNLSSLLNLFSLCTALS